MEVLIPFAIFIMWLIVIFIGKMYLNHKESLPDTPKYTILVKILRYNNDGDNSSIIAEDIHQHQYTIKDYGKKYKKLSELLMNEWVVIELYNKCSGFLFLEVHQCIFHMEKLDISMLEIISKRDITQK